jgi:hypothetical protein
MDFRQKSIKESSVIGHRLTDEINRLREELLIVKQEKRLLLISKQSISDENTHLSGTLRELLKTISEQQSFLMNQVKVTLVYYVFFIICKSKREQKI